MTDNKKYAALVMAAGEGTRMKSSIPKVLHKIAGKTMLEWAAQAVSGGDFGMPVIIVSPKNRAAIEEAAGSGFVFAVQERQLGTGDAVKSAAEAVRGSKYTVIIAGDMPLVRRETMQALCDNCSLLGYDMMLLTGIAENPTGYGRIVRQGGGVTGIVEENDATDEQKKIKEINLSCYCIRTDALLKHIGDLKNDNKKGEYYLTDLVQVFADAGLRVAAKSVEDMSELSGVNTKTQLAEAAEIIRARINRAHTEAGVMMIDPKAVYIEADVKICEDTVIYPGVVIEGASEIGAGVTLYPGSRIKDSKIADGATVQNSVILESAVGENSQIGPYAYLRPGSNIGSECRIGDFVEVKNSNLGDGTKVSHLTYVGDGDVGADCNIGCGVVFVNYDGQNKNRITVGDGCFIGCNTNLISPVEVGHGAYIAAGATVTQDVPDNALCIARAREVIKAGRAKGMYKRSK